jgi:hypothetical protein
MTQAYVFLFGWFINHFKNINSILTARTLPLTGWVTLGKVAELGRVWVSSIQGKAYPDQETLGQRQMPLPGFVPAPPSAPYPEQL